MSNKIRILRGVGMAASFCLAASITASVIMEYYRDPLDSLLGTQSSKIVTSAYENSEDAWNFKSSFQTAREACEGYKAFAIKESQETMALLKNENSPLPIASNAKISMFGVRSYGPVYGNSAGSIADKKTTYDNQIFKCFADSGFQLNPSLLATYQEHFQDEVMAGRAFGATPPEYPSLTKTDQVVELSPAELAAINSDYDSEYSAYSDAAIVVVGRPGVESKNYYLGQSGMAEGMATTTDNIMGLSSKEMEIIAEAKKCSSKVIVLLNATNVLEIKALADDPDIDAILWIGFPGAYGFHGVADILNGTVSPSAKLGDTYCANGAVAPAMQSFGNIPWANAADFAQAENVNSYLVEAEGIYSGYRYYETRYADIVNGVAGAATADEGTYTTGNGKVASVPGIWDYSQEVVYPFGFGLSYSSFTQTLDSVRILGSKKEAEVTVTVKNVGDVAGKDVIELYAQAPYTAYDRANGVEKAAVQLMDFEKTGTIAAGASQTVVMKVDMSNLASYDYTNAKTFIVDPGDYYFSLGNGAHEALNNILAAQGKTTANGMDKNGDARKAFKWTWSGEVDDETFAVSKAGAQITNALSDGNSSMDLNSFMPGTVTYLSRSDWNGTFPTDYAGLSANAALTKLLKNDFVELKTDDDTSSYKWGQSSDLTINDLKGAEWDDERWEELIDKMTVAEFLSFASNAFHHIQKIDSVGYLGNNADDGPGGSDTHYFQEGTYQGTPWADAADYTDYGTRVCPSQENLGYGWSKELAYENGEIILGETSLCLNLPIIIGPGMNLHRHGYNGRGGEYYSEDPMLSGYIGSNSVQGGQSKGVLVNIKHAAFNDQEINRSGIAVFMNEQKARELELRNLRQAFEGNGKPASFLGNSAYDSAFTKGASGVMTSYNRIGAVASSANYGAMVQIMRGEWGFHGYNVTDFTGVNLKAAPKESILYGTTAFCGFGSPSLSYWNEESLTADADMCAAIKADCKYILYSQANSNALNGINSSSRKVELMTSWRIFYITLNSVTGAVTGLAFCGYAILRALRRREGGAQ
jgi:beta-glucosidase